MKVLYVLDSLNRGGSEVFALDVCRNAKASGLDLTLAATGGGSLEKDFRESGIEFLRLERKRPVDLKLAFNLRQIIKEREIQIVHAHQAVEGLHGYLASLGTRAKLVLSFHGGLIDKKSVSVLRYLIHRASHSIFVSESLRKWYATNCGIRAKRNYSVLYNGIDQTRLSGKSIKSELGIPEDSILMGMTGNFHAPHIKDQMTICRALPRIFSEVRDAHFIFAGAVSKSGRENFEKCVNFCRDNGLAGQVHFLGERDDIPNILASLDVFVFSSLQEGMPIAVIEAMLSGLPLVFSDIAPLLEITDNGNIGISFKTGDAESLAEKVVKLLKDNNLRDRVARESSDLARQRYTISAHLKGLIDIYRKVLASGK